MLVPQWVIDHGMEHINTPSRVAVLVPRRSIAQGLSSYVSRLRGCDLGSEVGLGISGEAKMSQDSRVVFFTYGYYKVQTCTDRLLSKWDAVILDEAHERHEDADALMMKLAVVMKV